MNILTKTGRLVSASIILFFLKSCSPASNALVCGPDGKAIFTVIPNKAKSQILYKEQGFDWQLYNAIFTPDRIEFSASVPKNGYNIPVNYSINRTTLNYKATVRVEGYTGTAGAKCTTTYIKQEVKI